jgi:hypothetical protein
MSDSVAMSLRIVLVNTILIYSSANPEKILNDEVYQKSLQPNNQDPDVPNQMDFTTPAVSLNNQYKYNNTPIDVYSQYGALRSKNG